MTPAERKELRRRLAVAKAEERERVSWLRAALAEYDYGSVALHATNAAVCEGVVQALERMLDDE